jgi:hypothetical protein
VIASTPKDAAAALNGPNSTSDQFFDPTGFSWNGKTYLSLVQGRLRHDRHPLVRAQVFRPGSTAIGTTTVKSGTVKPVRCAIYTRVSTDHGLEQDFNSLDAQHDAAQAYIRSQAHAGWTTYGWIITRIAEVILI